MADTVESLFTHLAKEMTSNRSGSGGWGWVASHPPLGCLSLKLRKGTCVRVRARACISPEWPKLETTCSLTKVSLRRLCLRLFRYHSVRSATPLQKSWIRHWATIWQCFKSEIRDSYKIRRRIRGGGRANLEYLIDLSTHSPTPTTATPGGIRLSNLQKRSVRKGYKSHIWLALNVNFGPGVGQWKKNPPQESNHLLSGLQLTLIGASALPQVTYIKCFYE